MSDQQSNNTAPEQSDDTTNQMYELIELLEGVGSTRDTEVSSVGDVPNDKRTQPAEDENWSYPAEGTSYPSGNPYEEQYYMQHMHLSYVLERGLTGIHSELCQLSRSVLQLAYGMKECADTMGFYTTRMLAFQKEMLNITSKTSTSLQTGVHLLRELRAKHGPCPTDISKDDNRDGQPGRSDESKNKRHHRDVQPRSSEDNGLHYSKRDKKK